jgi:urease accessory protein
LASVADASLSFNVVCGISVCSAINLPHNPFLGGSRRNPSNAGRVEFVDLSMLFQEALVRGKTEMRHFILLAVTTIVLTFAGAATAHESTGIAGGFISGFLHPLFGWDHVVAMVAVGLWGAFLGSPAIWILPVVFPLVMAFGGALGVLGVPIPAVETGIGASAVVLGAMVAIAARPPVWLAAVIVGVFAIFHGHAHGTELPNAANPLAYSIGFVVSTGLLHLSGIAFGLLVRWPVGKMAVRTAGGAIALAGVGFLTGVV